MTTSAEQQAADAIADATQRSLADHARNVAVDTVSRRIRYALKPYLPWFLHPLLPGGRGSVVGRIKQNLWRWVTGLIFGLILTLVIFSVFAVGVIAVIGIVIWAVMQGM